MYAPRFGTLCAQRKNDRVVQTLEVFRIEIPSWGFANTGTRFGKFTQAAAASTIPRERVTQALQKYGIVFSEAQSTEDLRAKLSRFYADKRPKL